MLMLLASQKEEHLPARKGCAGTLIAIK